MNIRTESICVHYPYIMSASDDEIRYVSLCLKMINDLLHTHQESNIILAMKYMNTLQEWGCVLRLIDGNIVLIAFRPSYSPRPRL